MIAVRQSTVLRAVRLIGPQEERRAECEQAVTRAFEEIERERKTMHFASTSKAKRTVAKLLETENAALRHQLIVLRRKYGAEPG
jgi:hypothetical protein